MVPVWDDRDDGDGYSEARMSSELLIVVVVAVVHDDLLSKLLINHRGHHSSYHQSIDSNVVASYSLLLPAFPSLVFVIHSQTPSTSKVITFTLSDVINTTFSSL